MNNYDWRSTAFTPDHAGYTAWYLTDQGVTSQRVIGWLTQHQAFYGGRDLEYLDEQPTLPNTRISAAVLCEGEAVAVDSPALNLDHYWYVANPGAPNPTDDEIAFERKHREEIAAARTKREGGQK